jgi:UDP-2,4-diacetamido-2,4,6-trideoxy-beta-L-altropyranose hydrolase
MVPRWVEFDAYDQNLYKNLETRYDRLVPEHCLKLLGPQYALLRPEFAEARKKLRKRDGVIRRILIFFGGSDPANETAKAIQAICLLGRPDIAVDVVVGSANPHKEEVKKMVPRHPVWAGFVCQKMPAIRNGNNHHLFAVGGAPPREKYWNTYH